MRFDPPPRSHSFGLCAPIRRCGQRAAQLNGDRKMKHVLLIGWMAVWMAFSAQPQTEADVKVNRRPWEVDLSGQWKFSPGDDDKWCSPDFDDRTWETLHAPALWDGAGYADYDGFGWYRKWFHVPKQLEGQDLIFEHGGVDDDDTVFVNGVKIGEGKGCYRPRSYRIPAELIKYGQENLVAVRIYDGAMGGGLAHGPLRIRLATLSDRVTIETVRLEGAADSRLVFTLRNKENRDHHVEARYKITDYFLITVAEGTVQLDVPALKSTLVEVPFEGGKSKDYRIDLHLSAEGESCDVYRHLPARQIVGIRPSLLLSGEWEIMFPDSGRLSFPPTGRWNRADVPGTKGTPAWPEKEHCAWYRTTFVVPPEMSSGRIKLRFLGVAHHARVWVNGKQVGEHLGAFEPFEIDVTDAIEIGRANELLVGVTDWTVGLVNVKEIPENLHNMPSDSMIVPYGCMWYRPTSGGIWQDVYLVGHPDTHVRDVFVKTSVREKKLAVRLELQNDSDQRQQVIVKNEVWDGDKRLFSLPDVEVSVKPSEDVVIEPSAAWDSPRLWWPHDPHLYRLRTTVVARGKTVDQLDTRFGFRQFWIDGTDYRLNGLIFRLRGLVCPPIGASREEVREYYLSRMESNFSLVRFHMQPRAEYYYDIADEVGMCVKDESAFYCRARVYALKDQRLWKNLADHVRGMVLRARSHPSLCIWSVENEILHCGGIRTKGTAERIAGLGEIIRRLDPSRPIEYEGDGDVEGRAETVNIHYPREFGCHNHNLWPNDAYWLSAEGNDRWPQGLVWKKDKPLVLGEFCYFPYSRPPGGESLFVGDEAYLSREKTTQAHMFGVKMLCDGCRRMGVAGLNPWVGDPRYAEQCLRPVTVTFKQYDKNFFAGERVMRSLAVHNDTLFGGTFRLSWKLFRSGRPFVKQESNLTLEPGQMQEVPLSWTMPSVETRTEITLQIELEKDGQTVFEEEKAFSVFPPIAVRVPPGLKVSLLDKNGRTAALLRKMSVPFSTIDKIEQVSRSDTDLLLIGAGSLTSQIEKHALPLLQFVADGGKVFCFEQEESFAWLPIELKTDPTHSSTIVFRRRPEHPMLRGIEPDDLKFWRGDHVVSRRNFRKPHRGSFVIIADAGGNGGIRWTPLVEIKHGRGFFMLSQLALSSKLATEPAAQILLRNLFDYAASYRPASPRKVALVASQDAVLRGYLSSLGVPFNDLSETFPDVDLSPYGVLIFGRNEPGLSHAAKINEFARSGGNVLIHCPDAEDAQRLKALVPNLVAIASCNSSGSLVKLGDDFPLSGLTNSDFFWYADDCWYADWEGRGTGKIDDPATTVFRLNSGPATTLVRPAALVKMPVGKGWIILDAVRWDEAHRRLADKRSRIVTTILSNLGVRFDQTDR